MADLGHYKPNNRINRANGVPLYLQLIDIISRDIDEHVYKLGERLPSERELCEIYKLSRITVRQALQELEREGYINKEHGKGTFVAEKHYRQNLDNLYSFTDEMIRLGKTPLTEVLNFEVIMSNKNLANKMNVNSEEKIIKFTRLRIADNDPLMYETTYLPRKVFPHLTKKDLEKRTMYSIFREDYHVFVTKAIEEFTATSLHKKEAKHLKEENGETGILIKRFGYDQGQLVEYTLSVVSSKKFYYRVQINQ